MDYMKRVLLDTNMLIYREGEKTLAQDVQNVLRLLMDSDVYKACIHPLSVQVLKKHRNEEQQTVILSKIILYPKIENPPKPNQEFLNECGDNSCDNDYIDNCLLYSVKKESVDYFITNDKRLLKKAKRMNLGERVLSIADAICLLEKNDNTVSAVPLDFIEEEYLYNIDLNNTFFNSLKEDYKTFEDWFIKKSRMQTKAYITYMDRERKNIGAFLLLKIEDENEEYLDLHKPFQSGKRVKVSTLKVSDNGKSLGEAFIKIMIDYTVKNDIDELYVTIFPKHKRLISLLQEYGFYLHTLKETETKRGMEKECVFVKNMSENNGSYPVVSITNQNVFIVPIKHEFFQMLFPEGNELLQLSLPFVNGIASYSNAIKKVYISKSKIKMIKQGDILLFYASEIKKEFRCIGVVDEVFRAREIDTFENFNKIVKRRTVYDHDYLKNSFENNDIIIFFKYYSNLNRYVTLTEAKEHDIILAPPQTIQSISIEKFLRLIELSNSKKFIRLNNDKEGWTI